MSSGVTIKLKYFNWNLNTPEFTEIAHFKEFHPFIRLFYLISGWRV